MAIPTFFLLMSTLIYAPFISADWLPNANLMNVVLAEAPSELSARAWQVGSRVVVMGDRSPRLMRGNLRYGNALDSAQLVRLRELRQDAQACDESLSTWDRCLGDPARGIALFGAVHESPEGALIIEVLFAHRIATARASTGSLLAIQVMEYTLQRIESDAEFQVTSSRILTRT